MCFLLNIGGTKVHRRDKVPMKVYEAVINAMDKAADRQGLPTYSALLQKLKEVECSLGHSPEHNKWDLGASQLLREVRRLIQAASGE